MRVGHRLITDSRLAYPPLALWCCERLALWRASSEAATIAGRFASGCVPAPLDRGGEPSLDTAMGLLLGVPFV